MLEIISYTLAGIILYAVSDSILNQIEIMRGERLAHRDVVFFFIILVLATATFGLFRYFFQE